MRYFRLCLYDLLPPVFDILCVNNARFEKYKSLASLLPELQVNASDPEKMYHSPYGEPSAHVRTSQAGEEPFPSSSRMVNSTNASSGLEFHARAGVSGGTDTTVHLLRSPHVETQYDFSHYGPQFQNRAQASDVQFENTRVVCLLILRSIIQMG